MMLEVHDYHPICFTGASRDHPLVHSWGSAAEIKEDHSRICSIVCELKGFPSAVSRLKISTTAPIVFGEAAGG